MKKIVVIGPESTGKSTLCEQLAKHYDTVWCPEYAREYLAQLKTAYTFDDLLEIAQGQIELEERYAALARNHLYIIDTEMYVMKVWCEVAFEQCHTWILKQIACRKYDLFLLCETDLPWTKDELREYPDLAIRERLYKMYKDIMIQNGTPWAIVSGTDEKRLATAVEAIDRLLQPTNNDPEIKR